MKHSLKKRGGNQIKNNTKQTLFFSLIYAVFYQFFFLILRTFYHDLIIISDPLFKNPSPEQKDQFFIAYQNSACLPYSFPLQIISVFLTTFAFCLFITQIFLPDKKNLDLIGKKKYYGIVFICTILCFSVFIYYRIYANPYYYYMTCTISEILAVTYIVLFFDAFLHSRARIK